ncbi:hypothetical protein B0H16DRAFT_528440 [Mycena metata]|uniref:Uncharacterized protein n=1 Tax=Mycena metata TaxID=1033252 RepID=A0AAD7NIQ3_9AGAR|nr:hypothetical protein B0H16DRAFT_528440 [Mycena metata]
MLRHYARENDGSAAFSVFFFLFLVSWRRGRTQHALVFPLCSPRAWMSGAARGDSDLPTFACGGERRRGLRLRFGLWFFCCQAMQALFHRVAVALLVCMCARLPRGGGEYHDDPRWRRAVVEGPSSRAETVLVDDVHTSSASAAGGFVLTVVSFTRPNFSLFPLAPCFVDLHANKKSSHTMTDLVSLMSRLVDAHLDAGGGQYGVGGGGGRTGDLREARLQHRRRRRRRGGQDRAVRG